jgi:hypothetical protein
VVLADTLVLRERLDVAALWGERRWPIGRHAAIETGVRIESHHRVPNAPPVTLAPKLAARVTIPWTPLTVTAALARSYQYSQALAPAGPSVGPDLYLTDVWLLAGDTIPALRSDVATVGLEMWLGGGWIAAANGYLRRATGVSVPEPGPGRLVDSLRPIFVEAQNLARGVELSVRRLTGRWTLSGSYTYGYSTLEARSRMFPVWYRFPSPADRRHSVDLTAMAELSGSLRLGAAFTAATGAPFSRFLLGASCDTVGCPAETAAFYIEFPNAIRAPGYASLDVLADWSRPVGEVRLGAFVQVRNVLNLTNAVTYTGSVPCGQATAPVLRDAGGGFCDRFDRGVPILPLVGLRVAF